MAGKLEDRVKDIIVEQLGVNAEQVTTEASFIDDLGADSLDSVELIMAFEEEFGAAIPEEDAEKLTTVGKVVDYLKSKGYGDEAAAPAQGACGRAGPGARAASEERRGNPAFSRFLCPAYGHPAADYDIIHQIN